MRGLIPLQSGMTEQGVVIPAPEPESIERCLLNILEPPLQWVPDRARYDGIHSILKPKVQIMPFWISTLYQLYLPIACPVL